MDQFFHEIFKSICGHKSETMGCMELKIFMSDKHHRYYKHIKFCQNPRGDPKFQVELTWNDQKSLNKYAKYTQYALIRGVRGLVSTGNFEKLAF